MANKEFLAGVYAKARKEQVERIALEELDRISMACREAAGKALREVQYDLTGAADDLQVAQYIRDHLQTKLDLTARLLHYDVSDAVNASMFIRISGWAG